MRGVAICLVSVLSAACGRSGFTVTIRDRGDALTPHGDAEVAITPWGERAAALDVPACPPSDSPPLVVNTLETTLDGGETLADPSQAGATLSFIEALWISTNRPGIDQIFFSPEIFPASAPGVIVIDLDVAFPSINGPICIDARDRGVVLSWSSAFDTACQSCVWQAVSGSLLVGLVLERLPQKLRLAGSQVAGCVLDARYVALEPNLGTSDTLIGPGNAFVGGDIGVRLDWAGTGQVRIFDNDFGVTPSGQLGNLAQALVLFDRVVVEGNVFAVTLSTIQGVLEDGVLVEIRNNYFGVDRSGRHLGTALSGMAWVGGGNGRWLLGPGNVIRGASAGVASYGQLPGVVTITQNSISQCQEGIVLSSSEGTAQAAITSVSSSQITGTCPAPGVVELFSDPGVQGETFLGSLTCDVTQPWVLPVTVPSGRNVTATFTNSVGRTGVFSAPVAVP